MSEYEAADSMLLVILVLMIDKLVKLMIDKLVKLMIDKLFLSFFQTWNHQAWTLVILQRLSK